MQITSYKGRLIQDQHQVFNNGVKEIRLLPYKRVKPKLGVTEQRTGADLAFIVSEADWRQHKQVIVSDLARQEYIELWRSNLAPSHL